MKSNYRVFVDRLISRYEGGYCWDAGDPGGPTKYGITCYDYAEFRGRKMNSMASWAPLVKAMTLKEAEAIYVKKYALAIRFDDLPSGIDCCMMDYGVNSGTSRPVRVARAILNVPGGGSMDAKLLAALKKTNVQIFVDHMCNERLGFMHRIKNGASWARFGKGWGARVADLRAYCRHLASGGPASTLPPAADLSKTPTPKATNTPVGQGGTASATGAGGAVASATAGYFAGVPIWALVVGVVVLVIAGAAFEYWQHQKAKNANIAVDLGKAEHAA